MEIKSSLEYRDTLVDVAAMLGRIPNYPLPSEEQLHELLKRVLNIHSADVITDIVRSDNFKSQINVYKKIFKILNNVSFLDVGGVFCDGVFINYWERIENEPSDYVDLVEQVRGAAFEAWIYLQKDLKAIFDEDIILMPGCVSSESKKRNTTPSKQKTYKWICDTNGECFTPSSSFSNKWESFLAENRIIPNTLPDRYFLNCCRYAQFGELYQYAKENRKGVIFRLIVNEISKHFNENDRRNFLLESAKSMELKDSYIFYSGQREKYKVFLTKFREIKTR
jgi:hypothetical protein